jgi:hypothetical protein
LTAEQPKSAEFWTEMAVAIGDKADLEFRRDRVENATALHRRAVAANRTAAALNPRSTPTRTALRAQLDSLARTLVAARDHSGAAGVVEELVQLTPTAPGVRESAARVLAQCAEIAANDPKLEPKARPIVVASYADRAISLLRDGILRGELETGKIRGDRAFDRLKSRESFQTLGGVAPEGDRTSS